LNEGYVSRDQFTRVLRTESLLPLATQAADALIKKFAGAADRTARVDYRSFIAIVDPRSVAPEVKEAEAVVREAKVVDPAQVMQRVKAQVLKDRIRLEEFIRDADPLRKGFVTQHQLEAALSSASVRVSFEDVAALGGAYGAVHAVDSEGKPLVAWRRLVDDINLVFTAAGLEKDPGADVGGTVAAARTGSVGLPKAAGDAFLPSGDLAGAPRLEGGEEAQLREVLSALEFAIRTRGVDLTAGFQDFDKHNRAVLPVTQFRRVMDRLGLSLTDDELALVSKAFGVPSADRPEIQYKWFLGAIDDPDGFISSMPGSKQSLTLAAASFVKTGGPLVPSPSRLQKVKPARGPVAADDVIEKLKTLCATRGAKLRDFFSEHDRLRAGKISTAKFRSAFAASRLELTDEELTALETAYRNAKDPDQVNWRDISYQIDGGDERLEKLPTATVSVKTGKRLGDDVALGSVPEDDLRRILSDVQAKVATRRVNLKPRFQDYDPLRHNTVPKNRFVGVLQSEGLVTDPKDLALLAQAFQVVSVADKVNYLKFVLEVDGSISQ